MAKGLNKSSSALVGSWSFLIGVILAVLLGLGWAGPYKPTVIWLVFLLGIVVGLLNVTHGEAHTFLNAGTILALVSYLGLQVGVFEGVAPVLEGVLRSILALFIPATVIVALRAVFAVARR